VVNAISVIMCVNLSRIETAKPFFYLSVLVLVYLDVTWLASGLINPGIAIKSSSDEGQMCSYCIENGREVPQGGDRTHCHECQVCIE
jgi:hypothetical protein